MTADELIEYGRKYVKIGTSYGKGMQLCICTEKNIHTKANQYPSWYRNPNDNSFLKYGKKSGCANWEEYLILKGKKYGADCCGWIKKASYNGKTYDAKKDITIKEMAESCHNVVNNVSKALPGMLMWDQNYSHVAIYTGNDKCIESAPSCDGMAEHKWNYQGTNYWCYFGCLPWVAYDTNAAIVEPLKVGEKVKLQTNCPVYGTEKRFAAWVYRTNLYIRSINGSRVVVSTVKVGAVTGAVDIKYIERG